MPIMTHLRIDPERLRAARHRAGYSLREFGRVSQTDHNQLWMYENGRRNPQPRVLRRLAEALGVEVANLLKE
jgi:transcriptional regulator with XRE-family HTH domain